MVAWHRGKNAEIGRSEGAGLIDESLIENRISASVIDAAIEVHKILGGPGLLESIYEDALAHELELRNIPIKRQLSIPVLYKGVPVRDALRLDLLVDDRVIIEVKANESLLKRCTGSYLSTSHSTQIRVGFEFRPTAPA